MDYYIWILIVLGIIYAIYKLLQPDEEYFKKRGVAYRNNGQFVDFLRLLFKQTSLPELFLKIYNLYPNEKVIGTFTFKKPGYIIRDPEFIRKITIKDFDHFTDHTTFHVADDELTTKSLSTLNGQKWKDMRSALSPAFTGSKMRQMFELIDCCAKDFVDYHVKNQSKINGKDIIQVHDAFTRLTNDAIATCAFGISINSMKERNNDFFKMGQMLMQQSTFLALIKIIVIATMPFVARIFGLRFINQKIDQFFRTIIIHTMNIRTEQRIIRPDMINLLMQLRKGEINDDNDMEQKDATNEIDEGIVIGAKKKIDWTDDELIAQCLLFFLAGFSTTSFMLTFLSYELALNSDIQRRLIEEIDQTDKRIDGKLSYNVLQSMTYLNMVVSETLRKWPPAFIVERNCTKNYAVHDDGNFAFEIEKGLSVQIPIFALHHDEKYFKNPYKFDPERFSEENVSKLIPGAYIPFGLGPRSCIASRFALMKAKAIVYHMLKHFTFEVCEKTEVPFKLNSLFSIPTKGMFLELRKRID